MFWYGMGTSSYLDGNNGSVVMQENGAAAKEEGGREIKLTLLGAVYPSQRVAIAIGFGEKRSMRRDDHFHVNLIT